MNKIFKKIWNKIKDIFGLPPHDERPYNRIGFTEGAYVAIYVVIILYLIELLAELTKGPKVNEPWEFIAVKLVWAFIFLSLFGFLYLRNIRKEKIKK